MALDVIKKLVLVAYALSKDFTGLKPNPKNRFLYITSKIILVSLAFFYLTGQLFLVCSFRLLYKCLDRCLKLYHEELYGGLLSGLDVVFEIKKNKSVINVVLIFSCHGDPLILIDKLKQCAFDLHQSSYKFSSEIKNILGYRYYLKKGGKFEDVVHILKYNDNQCMTKHDLLTYLKADCSKIIDKFTWKATFFSQPILWNIHKQNEKQIPVVLTFRHALGDYLCLIGLIKKHFQLTEETTQITGLLENEFTDRQYASNEQLNNLHSKQNTFSEELNNVCVLRNYFSAPFKVNALNICDNSSAYLASFIEEQVEYIPKIKNIKRKLNVTFTEVLSGVITASICEYAQKRKIDLNKVLLQIINRPIPEDVPKIVNRTFDFENLENNSGAIMVDMPFESENIKSRIVNLHHYNQSLVNAIDPYHIYMELRYVCTYIHPLLTKLGSNILFTKTMGLISNVVGLTQCRFGDNTVDDIFFFSPEFLHKGFSFFIHSYAGRLQLILASREGLVRNREELQEILNNVIKYIDEAEKEILLK